MSYRSFFRHIYIFKPKWFEKFKFLPDLTFFDYDISVDGTNAILKLTVTNIGKRKSGETYVYFNAIDTTPPPGKNEVRIQHIKDLPPLDPNQKHSYDFKLTLLQINDNQINKIDVLIDPKNLVREINENNNILILGG